MMTRRELLLKIATAAGPAFLFPSFPLCIWSGSLLSRYETATSRQAIRPSILRALH